MNNRQIAQNLLRQIENCDATQLAGLCEDIVNQFIILSQCCNEALNDDWDRSDGGFLDMKKGIDDLFGQWEPRPRKVTIIPATTTEGAKIQIEDWGTTSMINFAQICYQANWMTYQQFRAAGKHAFTEEFCEKIVNESKLFPKQF